MNRWRYLYRRYLGWLPVQFCMVCGRAYWGGFPCFEWDRRTKRPICTWAAWMMDYCTSECAQEDPTVPPPPGAETFNPGAVSTPAYEDFHPSFPRRVENCSYCGKQMLDWVDPDWAHGRICRRCESIHEPKP